MPHRSSSPCRWLVIRSLSRTSRTASPQRKWATSHGSGSAKLAGKMAGSRLQETARGYLASLWRVSSHWKDRARQPLIPQRQPVGVSAGGVFHFSFRRYKYDTAPRSCYIGPSITPSCLAHVFLKTPS